MKMGAAALLVTLFGLAGCSKNDSTSQGLTALENAYKAGVLSKEEYESKRATLANRARAVAALEKAREAGLLTAEEYATKKAAIEAASPVVASAAAQAPVVQAAPTQAPAAQAQASQAPIAQAPIATPDPVRLPDGTTVPAQPNPGGVADRGAPVRAGAIENPPPAAESARAAAPAAAPVNAAQGHVFRMKMIKAIDAQGFERPMTAAAMLVPVEWQSQGGTAWNIKDKCNSIQTTLRASGPDGRGIEVFPAFNWAWADDIQVARMTAAQTAQTGMRPCDLMPPMGAGEYLKRNLGRLRPNAQLVGIEPAPKLMQILQQQARQGEQSAAQYGLRQQVRPDVVKGRVKYSLNGQAMEEWVVVATIATGTLGQGYDTRSMQLRPAWTYSCVAYVTGERAPQGQLEASESLFDLIVTTFRVGPEWQARVTNNAQQIQQIELKGVRDRSAIISKNADDIANIRRQAYANKQKSEDHVFGQYSEYQRGVETFRNPTTGETVELSNQYGHAWVNNRGEYLLTDQAGFDPGVTFKEDWKRLEPVKR